jgi:hypothetical protein
MTKWHEIKLIHQNVITPQQSPPADDDNTEYIFNKLRQPIGDKTSATRQVVQCIGPQRYYQYCASAQ